MRLRSRVLAAFAVVLTSIGVMTPGAALALPDPAPADVTAVASLTKEVSTGTVEPGQTFTYTITVGCSAITDVGCRDAVTTDVVPAPFVVVDAVVGGGANSAADPVISGNSVTVNWVTDLGDGTQGMLDNTTGVIEITAQLPEDASYDTNGIPVVNDALIEGTNFVDVDDQVEVTPVIVLELRTTAGKTLSPTTALAVPGTAVTADLSGSNDSNATVETLVVQDPVDPAASPNPFESLGFVGFGAVTPPVGANAPPEYFVYDVQAGEWVSAPGGTLPAGVEPEDVRGTRVVFTGDIPAGATAEVVLDLEVTDAAAAAEDGTVVANTVQSQVGLGGETASDAAEAEFTLRQNAVTVDAGKTFTPALVLAGESSSVQLDAANTSAIPIESMTIREPATGSFPATYVFTGITEPITAPSPSAGGTVVYHYTDGSSQSEDFASGDVPAAATDPADVAWFEVQFDGPIDSGASTSVTFGVETDADLDPAGLPITQNNEVLVTGSNLGADGSDVADDDLYVYGEVIEPYIGKSIRPSQIPAVPGQVVTVSLTGGLTERPNPPETPTGSTGDAQQIVIQDPQDPVEPNAWWNAFDLVGIAQTPVPEDAALTIEYYDTETGTWETLAGPIPGATIYSQSVPAEVSEVAGGVRFVYDWTGDPDGGFPPGTDVAPNFTSELRPDGRYEPGPPFSDDESTFVPNCAQADATSVNDPDVPPGSATMPADECPEVELVPADPGTADIIDKEFGTSSSGGIKSVIARSGDTIPSTLRWSTGGYTGIDEMAITDIADPEGTDIADSVYDAFNLTRIQAITADTDPLIVYDQVLEVLLWDGDDWVPATNSPCPAACDGALPAIALTAAEQLSTTGVRLVFAEGSSREAASEGVPDAPPVGSGVARSSGNERPITLVWQVRDERRSDGTPVLGDELYNLDDEGVVRNTVHAEGIPQPGGPALDATDQDDVIIVDVPITTTTDKNWQGGPLAVPADPSIPASNYPLSRVTITTRNTTPAMVDQLRITDPAPGSVTDRRQDPFQGFLLNGITTITVPSGATSTLVTLSCPDGTVETYDRAGALALTAATMPCDVSAIDVAFDGRIASGAAGVVAFDLRLRPFWRGTTERVAVADSPIANTAQGVVADVDAIGDCPPGADARFACDQDTATIALEEASFGVTAGKTISPEEQVELDPGATPDPVTVTISGQPSGSARPATMILTDDDPTFWNAFDFVGMDPSWAFVAPTGRVEVCYKSDGTFTDATVGAVLPTDAVGGTWTCSDAFTDIAAAAAYLADVDELTEIHGLSFQFWQGNDLGWQNPANPLVTVPFLVERRTDLRTGDPVPTTRADQTAAPGEQQAGIFHNTSTADATSVPIAPGQTLSDSADASAEYRHRHLDAAISVTKSPNGDVRPGVAVPYTLTFRNTGELALIDPVFRDRLPVAGGEPQLILDPDRDPSVAPWSFALSGVAPDPAHGTPLPTDADEVDVEIDDAQTVFTFRMPEGSVLEPDQTYTITIQLMLAPGLSPDDQVENWAAMAVDVPLDACVGTWDAATSECRDNAIVSPMAVPALSTVKAVKADTPVDEPGIPAVRSIANDYSCDDAADADGFYRAACIPTTLPGETETWRFTVTNAGTLPLDRVVSIDNLPTPGDQGLIVTLPRESAWQPTFTGLVELVDAPPGASLETFYSTSPTPCTADLNPLGTPCAAGAWLPLDDDVDPAIVRSLKFAVTFDAADLFAPGDSYRIEFQTETTPTDRSDTRFPIAYNTVATGGSAVNGATSVVVPATEGRRVGVSYPTGPVYLQKIVSGPGAEYAPAEFDVSLQCTSVGTDVAGLPATTTVIAGGLPTRVTGLPWGAECTATEVAQGQTSAVIGTAVVGGPLGPIGVVSIENIFELGQLQVTKAVDSAAVDAEGMPIGYDPFDFEVVCTFLDDPVYADGYGPDTPMADSLSGGETWTLTGLPIGAVCTVDETDAGAATSTEVTVTVDGDNPVVTDGTSVDVTIGGGADSITLAAFTNAVTVGAIEITKVVDGDGGDDWGAADFEIALTCTLAGADPDTVFDGTQILSQADPVWLVENLPTGAECTVTETQSGGANTPGVISPTGPIVVGAPAAGPTPVTVTNTFTEGAVTVSKVLEGAPAASLDPALTGSYTMLLQCTRIVNGITEPVAIPGGASQTITGAGSVTYNGLPTGAECTVTETGSDPVAQTVTVDPSGPFTVGEGATAVEVTVTNEFTNGSIAVSKLVTGDGAGFAPDSFTATVTCTWNGAAVALPDDGQIVLDGNGDAVVFDDIPTGSVCEVVETGASGATTVTNPDPVTIAEGETAELEIVNDYELAGFTVTKAVDAGGAVDQDGTPIDYATVFEFDASCLFLGDEVIPVPDQTFELTDGAERQVIGLPVGAECTVTETGTGGAASVSVNGAEDTDTFAFTLDVAGDDQVTVAFENHYTVGSVEITKDITGSGAEQWGNGPFVVELVCTFAQAVVNPVYSATHELSPTDPVWTVDDLPTGSECAVSELDDAGATESAIDPADGLITVGAAGTDGGLAVVTVTNDFRTGGLNVSKVVVGPGTPTFSGGPFVFAVECTYDGETVYTGDLTVTGDGSADPLVSETIEGLPVGAECTVTETGDGGADETAAPVTVTIPDEAEAGVASVVTAGFVNAFSAAELTLTKTLDGAAAEAEYATSAVFTVLVTCQLETDAGTRVTLLSREYDITGGETIELTDAAGDPIRLPLGAHCFGEETVTGGASAAVVSPDNYDDGLIVAAGDDLQTLELVATNTFEVGSLQLAKVVAGSGAAAHSSETFAFELTCVLDQGQVDPTVIVDGQTVLVAGGETVTIDDLPVGVECWVAETDTGGAATVEISNSTAAMPAVVTADQDAVITVVNTFIAPLPPTGSNAGPLLIAGGVALALIAGGVVVMLVIRRRRTHV